MPEAISRCTHEYAGRQLSKGDRFEVEPKDVTLLVALDRIEPIDASTRDDPAADTTLRVPASKRKSTGAARK